MAVPLNSELNVTMMEGAMRMEDGTLYSTIASIRVSADSGSGNKAMLECLLFRRVRGTEMPVTRSSSLLVRYMQVLATLLFIFFSYLLNLLI